MFVILSYDVAAQRNHRVRKAVKKYLFVVHESVFEGEISNRNLTRLKAELARIIQPQSDSVVLYLDEFSGELRKETLGRSGKIDAVLME